MTRSDATSRDSEIGWLLLARAIPWLPAAKQGCAPDSALRVANCGHFVWVSQQGLAMFEAGSCYTICLDCDMSSDSPVFTDPATPKYGVPGAVAAAKRHLGVGAADQLETWMRNIGVKEL